MLNCLLLVIVRGCYFLKPFESCVVAAHFSKICDCSLPARASSKHVTRNVYSWPASAITFAAERLMVPYGAFLLKRGKRS